MFEFVGGPFDGGVFRTDGNPEWLMLRKKLIRSITEADIDIDPFDTIRYVLINGQYHFAGYK